MKFVIALLLLFTLLGCSTPYTMPRYLNEFITAKDSIRKNTERDDTMAVCLGMDTTTYINTAYEYAYECALEEKDNRPYEFSYTSARAYGTADGVCARKKLITRHKQNVDLEKIPSKYRNTCKEIYNEFE